MFIHCIHYLHVGARQIRALRIRCDKLGCQWEGELQELESHYESCDYVYVSCTKECTTEVLRRDLPDHLTNECPRRQYQCPHCEEMGEHQERTTSHLETCPKVKVPCPNNQCEVSIPRCDVSTHRSTCDYEPVSCKYAEVGCEERPLRKDLTSHEEDAQYHLQIATKTIQRLKTQTRQPSHEQTNTSHFAFKLTEFQKHFDCNLNYYSPPFHTGQNGYRLCVRVFANGDKPAGHISVYAHLMKGDNDDSLPWPFTGTLIVELLNQLEDSNHHMGAISFPASSPASRRVLNGERASRGYGCPQFISHNKLHFDPDKNYQYLKNDTLAFQISIA